MEGGMRLIEWFRSALRSVSSEVSQAQPQSVDLPQPSAAVVHSSPEGEKTLVELLDEPSVDNYCNLPDARIRAINKKIQIQNDKLKDHVIERPLQMLDLSKWEEK